MDWNILIDAVISIITPPIWAISFRIAWPSIKDMLNELPKNQKKEKNDKIDSKEGE